jgi:Zn-dependent M16 (insulinase) family peptidase
MNVMNNVAQPMPYKSFEVVQSHHIPLLNATLQEYVHQKTGARHIHLATDDPHNVFLVSFLTVPQDSKGVAHILEHTALCGSERFPVRDPFFMMIRRSLNTFMNAFTAGDWTAYPFATLNKKDFANLLDVYLDAAFFPRLDALDFAQEGHRIEFEKADDPTTPLQYKGVVFNEMKGAMSDPVSRLSEAVNFNLFPTITYHHNSGGEPADIPDLTHEELLSFHQKHYHPSNALFFTYGDISAAQHQQDFEEKVLHKFDKLDTRFSVPDEQRYQAPITAEANYPLAEDENPADKTYITMSWLLEPVTDIDAVFENQLMEAILLDNSASPLMAALEQSDLGTAPAPTTGYGTWTRETTFSAGLQGSNADQAEAVQALILNTLEQVEKDGIAPETIDAMLHQFELSQREISGGSFPYGLQLIMDTLGVTIHGGDPVKALDIDPYLEALKEKAQDPSFIPNLIRKKLLDNPHRLRLVMRPDSTLAQQEADTEQARLDAINATLDDSKRDEIIKLGAALAERQATEDDPNILPTVTLADVADDKHIPSAKTLNIGEHQATIYEQGTNGIAYQRVVLPLPKLDEKQLQWLPLYTKVIGELGAGELDYMQVQESLSAVTGGIGLGMMIRPNLSRNNQTEGYLVMSGKALGSRQAKAVEWIKNLLQNTRFDEHKRLKEILQQIRAGKLSSIVGSGHGYAMGAASAAISPIAARNLAWEGLAAAKTLKEMEAQLEDNDFIADIAATLTSIHQAVAKQAIHLIMVGEAESLPDYAAQQTDIWQDITPLTDLENAIDIGMPTIEQKTVWTTNSQVNYVAIAYPAVHSTHEDTAALHILSEYLRNTRLHTLIREKGGAYGGGASFHSDSATFRFYSYRDPRTQGTIDDFLGTQTWMAEHDHQQTDLNEAILSVISSVDKPGSPAGEALGAYFAELFGATKEWRKAARQKLLEVTLDDIKRVASLYLDNDKAHIAVVGGQEAADTLGAEYVQYQV